MNENEKRALFGRLHEHGNLVDPDAPPKMLTPKIFLTETDKLKYELSSANKQLTYFEKEVEKLEQDLWEQNQTPLESHPMIAVKTVAAMLGAFVGGYLIGSAGNHVARLHKWLNG